MPTTRKTGGAKKAVNKTPKKTRSAKAMKAITGSEAEPISAYEKLYNKVKENQAKRKIACNKNEGPSTSKKSKMNKTTARKPETPGNSIDISQTTEPTETTTRFLEDDSFVDMEVTADQYRQFPSPSDEEDSNASESDDDTEAVQDCSTNNNATVGLLGAQGSLNLMDDHERQLPDIIESNPQRGKDIGQTFALLQKFMIKKGIICEDEEMDMNELQEFIQEGSSMEQQSTIAGKNMPQRESTQIRRLTKQRSNLTQNLKG